MKSNFSTWAAYTSVKKNRRYKKKQLYLLAFGVSFDVTVLIYLGLYMIFGAIILYENIQQYGAQIRHIEVVLSANSINLVFILVIRSITAAFTRPGVPFSSTEFKMSLLPFSKAKLWLYCAVESWLIGVLYWTVAALLIGILTPFSVPFLIALAGIILLMQVLMKIPQWKLYQLRFTSKMLIVAMTVILMGVVRFVMIETGFILRGTAGLFITLLAVNVVLFRKLLQEIDWQKVVQTNDLIIWNMWFVNKMSHMEIKPPARQSWLSRVISSKKSRKPFDYQHQTAIYKRLWKSYLTEQKETVLRTLGSLLIILVLLSFHGDLVFGAAISLAIFLFVKMAASFFIGGFGDRLIFCLPWQLTAWKRAFLYWSYRAGLLVGVLTLVLLALFQMEVWWIPLQLLLYAYVLVLYIEHQLDTTMSLIAKAKSPVPLNRNLLMLLLFLLTTVSIAFPMVTLVVVVLLGKDFTRRKDGKIKNG
ncbi:hypothetical protein [Sediminibacillus albus]|uniref:Uncharacterized protein n=1 Tax=Sediminibacillus albus TaxID=407036 RepID=A0A1G8WYE6_9BACI|nr:hypothetical protein [Sediminibacillus albus]SDJ83399.1 hypothetical protein SAMN05216243_1064 [Sediminibacillus albus]